MNIPILLLTFLLLLNSACTLTESADRQADRESKAVSESKLVSLGINPIAEDEAIYWVNSLRADCMGVAPMSCLQVQEGGALKQEGWQLFYSSIEGFSYEAGYVYKLLLRKESLPLDQVPADASSIKYSLVSILEKAADATLRLNDIWALERIQGELLSLEEGMVRPQLEIYLRDMKLMGNDGCNQFFGSIKTLSADSIAFGPIAGTRKFCQEMNLPDRFNLKMSQVSHYKINNLALHFFDLEGEEVLVFRKVD